MSYVVTSAYAKQQMEDILTKMEENRGITDREEIIYNGIKYKSGDILSTLQKDYKFWEKQYNKARIYEGTSTNEYPEYKLSKGWEI